MPGLAAGRRGERGDRLTFDEVARRIAAKLDEGGRRFRELRRDAGSGVVHDIERIQKAGHPPHAVRRET